MFKKRRFFMSGDNQTAPYADSSTTDFSQAASHPLQQVSVHPDLKSWMKPHTIRDARPTREDCDYEIYGVSLCADGNHSYSYDLNVAGGTSTAR